MTTMKQPPILFLDVDGVLSSFGERGLCSTRLDLLCEIIHQTGAEVVLSSTWRVPSCREQRLRLQQELGKRGVELAGMTGVGVANTRGEEIQIYLNQYRRFGIPHFVILDDDPNDEMGKLKGHLVKCDGWTGLTPEIAKTISEKLISTQQRGNPATTQG